MKFFKVFICWSLVLITLSLNAQNNANQPVIYKQLKKEGWHRKEIDQLTQFYVQHNSCFISSKSPNSMPLPVQNEEMLKDISQVHNWIDKYSSNYKTFEEKFPLCRKSNVIEDAENIIPGKKFKREAGKWKHIPMYATAGRIYDLELHPDSANVMYANPDGDGIFVTQDGGLSWKSISDNIPDRLHRNSYENIIVDPSDFRHVFSISRLGNMYETQDGGVNWERVENTVHKEGKAPQFKWVEAFRDSNNELILIGTVTKKSGYNHGWEPGVYRTSNSGQSWNMITEKGGRYQEMAFHQIEKDVVYLADTANLYKSTDAGASFELLYDFGFGNRPMFIAPLAGKQADALYVVVSKNDNTQVHFSANQGKTWELRQDSEKKIGFEEGIFGGYGSGGWISFFAVDPFNSNHLIASSVSSCESFDGGINWEKQAWYKRAFAQMPDGSRPLAPYGSHNADNHVLKFHPRKHHLMVKGCDAGIMKKEKADTNWVNINGNMPAFLWYSVVVNEFGDRYIAGNTQDVNVQTYRYNSWENDRGYEGDAIFMNPSTNTTYYPVAKTEDGEGVDFLEPGFWKMHSWSMPKTAVNYKNLDQFYIAYGRRPTEPEKQLPKFLYVTNNRGISFKRVPNMNDKEVFSVNVSRTEQEVLTAFTAEDVMTSVDEGESWITKKYPENFKGKYRNRKVSGCVDPYSPNRMWVGADHGDVLFSENGGESWTSVKGSLPDGHVLELLYHEGTPGDLYVLIKGYGVFYRSASDTDWKLWMDGFNLADFTEIRIDYPAQKLLASSYGRGLWEADLEQTVDRFFPEGVKIESKGCINGKHVFQVDTKLEIPAYYNYQWKINDIGVGNNSQRLLADNVKPDDIVEVVLSSVYSPEIVLKSIYKPIQGNKLSVETKGNKTLFCKDYFIDAGYVDAFGSNQDFSFSISLKPYVEGVIAANRRTFYRDAKGWFLEVSKEGELHLNAAFFQNRSMQSTLGKGLDQSINLTSEKGVIAFNQWSHIVVNVDRKNGITLYCNGNEVAHRSLDDIPSALSLNNVFDFTLLADSYGKYKMVGELKDVAIHSELLNGKELKRIIKKGNYLDEKTVFYINFQSGDTEKIEEYFSREKLVFKGEDYFE